MSCAIVGAFLGCSWDVPGMFLGCFWNTSGTFLERHESLEQAKGMPPQQAGRGQADGWAKCLEQCVVFLEMSCDSVGAFLGCSWDVPGTFLGCSWDVPRMFLRCSWDVPGMFLGCFWNGPGTVLEPHESLEQKAYPTPGGAWPSGRSKVP